MKTYLDKNNKIPKAFEWAWPKNVSKRVRFIEELRLDYCLETPILTHLSRNISVRKVMTTHERAWFRFRKSEKNGVGGVDVTVEKEFLCDSFLNGPFGTTAAVRSALRGFGFWRYTTNEKLANKGLMNQCNLWMNGKFENSLTDDSNQVEI